MRDDLRLADNPALSAAVARGGAVACVYVLDETSPGSRPLGGAARWWLHHSLTSLERDLTGLGGVFVVRQGRAEAAIAEAVQETGATAVFWNRRYGAAEREFDTRLGRSLTAAGVEVETFNASLLFEPWTIRTGQGTPFAVFTPFWRACLSAPEPPAPLPTPTSIRAPHEPVASLSIDDLGLLPTHPDWAAGLREIWQPGEETASRALDAFLAERVADYSADRDRPDRDGTSGLSPHLRWGELGPRQVWHAAKSRRAKSDAEGVATFLTELGWREFAYHTLYHSPQLATANLRAEFDRFPWPEADTRSLEAWRHGRTGIPLVDAGMRELWHTGTMHNRVRMVAASFLTKNLLVDWRIGEQWFWDTLVDADPASNPFNWQWVAGSGADAAPYFRIFNPELQRTKFDPHGEYVRRWVPEASTDDYPAPVVNLAESRRAALAAYERMRRG